MTENAALTYTSYLKVNELLNLQTPLSDGPEHDELLFIIIHQSYELWFKQIKHEFRGLQKALEDGDATRAGALLNRIRTILKIIVSQVDILETMTPLQFNSFRDRLASSSGFQSLQFREVEAMLGRRDSKMDSHLPNEMKDELKEIKVGRSVWDSFLVFLSKKGWAIPNTYLDRDFTIAYEANEIIQDILVKVHHEDEACAAVAERMLDVDEGLQEWRYRHIKMVERTIGHKMGTGGSSGAQYLQSTLFKAVFPDLWAIRDRL
jgi:tryptophan 2,3-dioxygenase